MTKELITLLFGTYEPIYTELNGVYTIPNGISGVDIPYVSGVVLFLMFLYLIITLIRILFRS